MVRVRVGLIVRIRVRIRVMVRVRLPKKVFASGPGQLSTFFFKMTRVMHPGVMSRCSFEGVRICAPLSEDVDIQLYMWMHSLEHRVRA